MDKRCVNYVGLACVNGNCPIALQNEYPIMETVDCESCWYYKGCSDCALAGTEYCKEEEFYHGSEE